MTKRQSGQVQPIRLQTEESHARATQGSYADTETTAYIQNCRQGVDQYVYPPDSFAWEGVPPVVLPSGQRVVA